MNKNDSLLNRIKEVSVKAKSNWGKDANFRIENRKWLDYSSKIAIRIASAIEEKENFNQESLAELLNISPQQISKIIKGQQNLTLKTIGNLSDALNVELISFPPYKDSYVRLMKVPLATEFPGTNIKYLIGGKTYIDLRENKLTFIKNNEDEELKNISIRPQNE